MKKSFKIQIKRVEYKYYLVLADATGHQCLETIPVETKQKCAELILLLKRFGAHDEHYLRMVSPHNEYYFLLRDDDGKLIATSIQQRSMAERNQAIVNLRRFIKSPDCVLPRFAEEENN